MTAKRPRLISLNHERDRRIKAERQKVSGGLRARTRHMPDDLDGYALIGFRHLPGGEFETWTYWQVREMPDAFRLPSMARQKLSESIHESADPSSDDESDED